MEVSVTNPELQRFIAKEIELGHFTSAAEVIEAGLARLMLDHAPKELDDETWSAIEEAEAQFARGEGRSWSDVREELASKYLKK